MTAHRLAATVGAFAAVVVATGPASAHGFGERYDLPVPLAIYIGGAGAAVALSFLVVGLFVRSELRGAEYPRIDLYRWRWGRMLVHPLLVEPIRAAALTVFVLVVVAGFWGNQDPAKNLGPTVVWVLWWVGIVYVCGLIGNVWALINPWSTVYRWSGWLVERVRGSRSGRAPWDYPTDLGAWPAVLVFAAFAWVEIVYADSGNPSTLALLILGYSAFTWAGMVLFGPAVWLRNGEAFSIVFGILARLAPVEIRVTDSDACAECADQACYFDRSCADCYECFGRADPLQRGLAVRPFAAGLLRAEQVSMSRMALVLVMLATVTFDGLTETGFWADINLEAYNTMRSLGRTAFTIAETAGLFIIPFVFGVAYFAFMRLVAVFGGNGPDVATLGRTFVLSLVPIAFAYHVAHFFSFFLIKGQLIIPLASDPLGQGWDLFGTADFRPDIGIVNARVAWFVGVGAIVTGHIVAVYTAHVVSLRVFPNRVGALRSQAPMLVLMVGYTMLSLWIIAQPIV